MKCVTLDTKLHPTDPKEVLNLEKKPARLFIEEHFAGLERMKAYSEILENLRGIHSEYDFDRLTESVKVKVATLGSDEPIFCPGNNGLFASILTAYNNHWNLRTSPEDWWFCVIRRVALDIDEHANKDRVRKMFVNHEGKKTLQVGVPSNNIYDVDYSLFFDKMSTRISENVNIPEYVDAVTADFSVTTPTQRIVSQITLMTSLQEFFIYKMMTLCWIPAIEMLGTEEDWRKLQSKLKLLRKLTKPVKRDIGLTSEWWGHVKKVFKKLLATYKGKPDRDWWSRIVSYQSFGSGNTNSYTGWITKFITGIENRNGHSNFPCGLVSVPLTIADPSGVLDTGILAAGTLGFTIHENTSGGVPSVQPFQGWSLLLAEDSPFRHQ